jgi:hypothetical protein
VRFQRCFAPETDLLVYDYTLFINKESGWNTTDIILASHVTGIGENRVADIILNKALQCTEVLVYACAKYD